MSSKLMILTLLFLIFSGLLNPSSKEFAAVILPECVSPVLNIAQMIFLKELTRLIPKFVEVHYPHSTVKRLPLFEVEE